MTTAGFRAGRSGELPLAMLYRALRQLGRFMRSFEDALEVWDDPFLRDDGHRSAAADWPSSPPIGPLA